MGSHDKWYRCAAWRKRRAYQLQVQPLCEQCAREGKNTVATTVDHVVKCGDDYNQFMLGELQSLCQTHHNRWKARIERIGFLPDVDESGWPIDPNHPSNRARGGPN
jgi:5-methylcytosine-specific restriction protein A